MSTKFLSPGWRMPRNANQSKSSNYSLDFDGSQQINVSDLSSIPTGASPRTVSAWFNSSYSSTGEPVIISYGANANAQMFNIMLKGGSGADAGRLRFVGYNRDHTFTTADLRDSQWHHVAMTYNGTIVEAFLDGSSVGNFTPSSVLNTGTSFFKIGVQWTYWEGQISQLCIFDYVLSPSQVTTLYGTGSAIGNPMALPSPPIAYYPLGTSAWNGNFLAENNAIGDYVFDNIISSRIFTTINVSNLTNVTQSVWFKTSTNGQSNKQIFFVGQYGTFVLQLFGTDTLRAGVTVNPLSQTYPSLTFNYADGKWHQYIMNYDGSHVKLYIDGVLRIKTARTGTLRDEPTYFTTIGNVQGTSANAGAIGEYSNFVAYEHTLTDGGISIGDTATGEIATLYNYGSPIQTLANIPQNSNLKAWYKLDASEIYNSSSTEWEVNDATATYNSSSFVKPIPNQNTQQIQVNNFAGLTGASAGSWSFWYNTQDFNNLTINGGWFNGGQARWIGPYGTPHTGYTNTGEFNIYTSDGTQRTSLAASYGRRIFIDAPAGGQLNKWAHFVGTYDGSNLRVYMNGEQVGTGTGVTEFAATGTLTTNSIRFGGAYSYNSAYDAKFSNGSVWNKTLTLAEIVEIYNNGKPKSLSSHSAVSNLVSWWKLDNLTTGLVDSIGGYNATLVGSNSEVSPGSVSVLNGESSGMSQSNVVQSDLQTVAPYSKYAMSFDGTNEKMAFNNSPINLGLSSTETWWIKYSNSSATSSAIASAPVFAGFHILYEKSTNKIYYRIDSTNLYYEWVIPSTYFSDDLWHHYAIVRDDSLPFSSYIKLYIDGDLFGSPTAVNATSKSTTDTKITDWGGASAYSGIVANFSNIAFWNTALTPSEAREIYNEGLPTNLNTFSGTAPVVWWQMGSNSSFDGNSWTCADEIGSNNGATSNIGEESLVNGVGTTANGTSSGMGVGALVGDAPYSTANAISSGMAVTAKGTNVP